MNEKLTSILAIIFTPEMGKRLSIARMKMQIDQAELGRLLGVNQHAISRIERGKSSVLETPFTLARFEAIMGGSTTYVLFGTGAERFREGIIRQNYWKLKLRVNRKSAIEKSGI